MPILDQINIQALLCCVELLTYLPVNGKQERREVPPTLKASTKVILFLLFLVTGKYFVRWRPLLVWGVYVSDPDTKHHGTSTISKSVGYKNHLFPHPSRKSSDPSFPSQEEFKPFAPVLPSTSVFPKYVFRSQETVYGKRLSLYIPPRTHF